MLCNVIALKRQSNFLESRPAHIEIRKDAQEFTEYQHPGAAVRRDISNDRVFPLETVEIQRFRRENNRDIDQPVHIHYGPSANEYARSFNALAFAIGFDIFFRSNAYQPESEDGRKLLSHELTHVAQYAEGKIGSNATEGELEAEAELAEQRSEFHSKSWSPLTSHGKIYWIQQSERKKFIDLVVDKLEYAIENRKYNMDERDYLEFLTKVEHFYNS
jgi:hypothetical protein